LEILLEDFWLNVKEAAKSPSHGVVNHYFGYAGVMLDAVKGGCERIGVGNVAGDSESVGKLTLQVRQTLGGAREHGDLVPAVVEPPHYC
jgi:hypothetical protein